MLQAFPRLPFAAPIPTQDPAALRRQRAEPDPLDPALRVEPVGWTVLVSIRSGRLSGFSVPADG